MTKQEKQVREFNKAFNIPTDESNPDRSDIVLRENLYLEELEELEKAIAQNDLIEVFDALIDITYIHKGLQVLKGVSYPITLNGTHSNIAKLTSYTKIGMSACMSEIIRFIDNNDLSDNLNIQKLSF